MVNHVKSPVHRFVNHRFHFLVVFVAAVFVGFFGSAFTLLVPWVVRIRLFDLLGDLHFLLLLFFFWLFLLIVAIVVVRMILYPHGSHLLNDKPFLLVILPFGFLFPFLFVNVSSWIGIQIQILRHFLKRKHPWILSLIPDLSDACIMLEVFLLEVSYVNCKAFGVFVVVDIDVHWLDDGLLQLLAVDYYIHIEAGRKCLQLQVSSPLPIFQHLLYILVNGPILILIDEQLIEVAIFSHMSASLFSIDSVQAFIPVHLIGNTPEQTVPVATYIPELYSQL